MTKATEDKPEEAAKTPTEQPQTSGLAKAASRGVWMGTAVGIGSAAIVAALLYTSKKRG